MLTSAVWASRRDNGNQPVVKRVREREPPDYIHNNGTAQEGALENMATNLISPIWKL